MKRIILLAALSLSGCALNPGPSSLPYVSFDVGGNTLSSVEIKKLDGIISNLSDSSSIVLTGYADNRGSDDFNRDLSIERAKFIKEYIRSKGSHSSITISGMGESMSFCEEFDCDRRVTIEVK